MFLRAVLLGLAAALGVFALAIASKQPREDRAWQPHLAVTPGVEEAAGIYRISPVRDWTYTQDGPATTGWLDGARIDPAALERVWLVLEPHPGLAAMAHTLVLFEFGSGELVGLTIEARKETHETFAPIRGALNRFELVYVWATPRDLMTRRAVMLGHELELYPLELTGDQARAFLLAVIARTRNLSVRPRFYNTAFSNCTNELAKAAQLDWDPAFIATGGAARALFARGLIAGPDFETARQRAQVAGWVRAHSQLGHAEFNCGLLRAGAPNTVATVCKAQDSR